MNLVSFINKYQSFYLPPGAETIYETLNLVNIRITNISHCLKLKLNFENKYSLVKTAKIRVISIPQSQKLIALKQFEEVLTKVLSQYTSLRPNRNPVVNAI